jgi:hypothetical protein
MKTIIKDTEFGRFATYKRDKWYEWFVVEVGEGGYMPFYYPVKKNHNRLTMTSWICFLVPFVLVIELFKAFIKSLYLDTRNLLDMWLKRINK